MTAYRQATQKNAANYKNLVSFLQVLPNALLSVTVDYTLGKVMEPAHRNFAPSLYDKVSGDKMPHSSSNAAYNWRVAIGPKFDAYEDFKGRGKVGAAFEERSNSQDPAMYEVMASRRKKDILPLYSKLLSSKGISSKVVYLYNPVSGVYAENANLEAVQASGYKSAETGYARAKAIVESYQRGPVPNAAGLKAYLLAVVANKG